MHSFWKFWRHGFKRAFKKSWEKYGHALIAFGLLYFVVALCLSKYTTQKPWGVDMSFWIQLAIPTVLLVAFLGYHFLRAPYEIYKEQFEKHRAEIEGLELEIKNHKKVKPLEIFPLPIKITPLHNPLVFDDETGAEVGTAAECVVEIHNPNQGVAGVRVRVLKIEPPMPTSDGRASTEDCNLRSLYLPFTDIPDEALNTNSSGYICVFKIIKTSKKITARFEGKWKDECKNEFIPKEEHFITIQAEANGVRQKDYQFKVSFSLDPTQPIFVLEKIELGLVIDSANWFAWDDEWDQMGAEKDVTEIIVTRFLIDGKLEVLCETLQLGDPCHDREKTLKIDYSFNGKKLQKSFPEHAIARLP